MKKFLLLLLSILILTGCSKSQEIIPRVEIADTGNIKVKSTTILETEMKETFEFLNGSWSNDTGEYKFIFEDNKFFIEYYIEQQDGLHTYKSELVRIEFLDQDYKDTHFYSYSYTMYFNAGMEGMTFTHNIKFNTQENNTIEIDGGIYEKD